MTPSRSTMSASPSVIALRDRAEYAVDETARVVGRELRRQLDRFGDHNADRNLLLVQQLVGSETQQRAVHRGHPLERPALREVAQEVVGRRAVLGSAIRQ